MRLKPVIACGPMREIATDLDIGDYTIPAGTSVNVHTYSVHRNPKIFPNPNEFYPRRFFDPHVLNKARNDSWLLDFSAGKRDCIGKRFAKIEMKAVLMIMFHNLKFTCLEEPETISPSTLQAKDGIIMKAERRR
jgi:cytochrome P450